VNHATIADLEVDVNKPITPMIIKNLVDVVNKEFDRQKTLYDAGAVEKREQILDEYKKAVGFDKLKAKYDKALGERAVADKNLKEAEESLNCKGLTVDGNEYTYHSFNPYGNRKAHEIAIEKSCKKVQALLKVVETQGPDAVRNKIVCRLWTSSTVGEAMVILREVLGNGIIPTLDVKQLPKLEG